MLSNDLKTSKPPQESKWSISTWLNHLFRNYAKYHLVRGAFSSDFPLLVAHPVCFTLLHPRFLVFSRIAHAFTHGLPIFAKGPKKMEDCFCSLWIFIRENSIHMVQASKISLAPLLLETWRAAGWCRSGICVGYLPWEVLQVCPSGRTTLGRTQDLGWPRDPPGRARGHVRGECSCSNRLLDGLDLYFTVQHILSDSPNVVYVIADSSQPTCFFSDSCCVQVLPMWLRVYQQKAPKCQIKRAFFSGYSR